MQSTEVRARHSPEPRAKKVAAVIFVIDRQIDTV
jgi:hypothetical protein